VSASGCENPCGLPQLRASCREKHSFKNLLLFGNGYDSPANISLCFSALIRLFPLVLPGNYPQSLRLLSAGA
jgi:hypothetical protein